jgi:hypothetical protein
MFRVEVNNGAFVLDYDETVITTVAEIVQQFQKDYRFRFAASPLIYDSSQGAHGSLTSGQGSLPYDTATSEGRTYAMTCWITQQLDEKGEPIKKSILI